MKKVSKKVFNIAHLICLVITIILTWITSLRLEILPFKYIFYISLGFVILTFFLTIIEIKQHEKEKSNSGRRIQELLRNKEC